MIEVLSQGYKTIDLFRKRKNKIRKVTMMQQLIAMSTLKKYSFHYTKGCSYIYIISKREKVFEMKSYIVVGREF